ncbi:USP32 isoform 1, partial [Pan troglodytes]
MCGVERRLWQSAQQVRRGWRPFSQEYCQMLILTPPVTDVELKRLKDAFKRTCGLSYYMGQHCFIREVLGDGVPPKVAEVIYCSFGGTSKGLHFNNLIVGLVLLTRGKDEEKAKYIFSLFSSESGNYVIREEMERMLHVVDGKVPDTLRKCFSE